MLVVENEERTFAFLLFLLDLMFKSLWKLESYACLFRSE